MVWTFWWWCYMFVSVDVFLFHFVSFVFFSSYSCYFVYPHLRDIFTMCFPDKISGFQVGLFLSFGIVPTGIPIFEDHDQLQLSSSFLRRLGRLFQGKVPFKGFWTKLKGLPWEEVGRKVISKNKTKKRLQTMFYQAFWGEKHGSVSNGNVTYHSTDIFPGSSWQVGELGVAEVSSPLCWSLSSWEFFPPPSASWRMTLGDQDRHVSVTEIWVKVKWLEVFYGGRKRERLICLVGMGWRGIINFDWGNWVFSELQLWCGG